MPSVLRINQNSIKRPKRAAKKTYTLIGKDGKPYVSEQKGLLGGNKALRIYGRLDCPSALRWIAKGKYIAQRVFFKDESTAVAAGYRPCARCMPIDYALWKQNSDELMK